MQQQQQVQWVTTYSSSSSINYIYLSRTVSSINNGGICSRTNSINWTGIKMSE